MKILIKNCNIFDGETDILLEDRNIVIEDNIVSEIISGTVPETEYDSVLDARGLTAMPGLTDSHVHLGIMFPAGRPIDYTVAVSAAVAKDILMHGFTTVRDCAGITGGLKAAFDLGLLPGPRIYPSNACVSQTCGHGDSEFAHINRATQFSQPAFSVLADGTDEVRRAVREQFIRGASQIKIMAGGGCSSQYDPIDTVQYSLDEMKTAVETASDYGTYVMAHLYTNESMQRAAKAGVKSFEHGQLMNEETARIIQDKGIFVTPAPQFNKNFKSEMPRTGKGAAVKKAEPQATELLNKYNINILFGTDTMIWGTNTVVQQSADLRIYAKRFGNFRALFSAAGVSNRIIKLTTYQNPYPDGQIGILKKGSYADILLVKGNPLEDIEAVTETDNIKLIMKDAVIYKNTLGEDDTNDK